MPENFELPFLHVSLVGSMVAFLFLLNQFEGGRLWFASDVSYHLLAVAWLVAALLLAHKARLARGFEASKRWLLIAVSAFPLSLASPAWSLCFYTSNVAFCFLLLPFLLLMVGIALASAAISLQLETLKGKMSWKSMVAAGLMIIPMGLVFSLLLLGPLAFLPLNSTGKLLAFSFFVLNLILLAFCLMGLALKSFEDSMGWFILHVGFIFLVSGNLAFFQSVLVAVSFAPLSSLLLSFGFLALILAFYLGWRELHSLQGGNPHKA